MKVNNPIIPGFFPDPSIIRVEDTYYIANSTFEWFPGVSVHESKDLVNWKLITYPLSDTRLLDLKGVPDGGGVWAPCLSYDKGIFYLVYSIVRTDEEWFKDVDNYLTTSDSIYGPWSDPVYLNSSGFDASLFHDTDGSKWLVNMLWDFIPGHNMFRGIALQKYDVDKKCLTGLVKNIFTGTNRGFTEGPHLYQKNGYYYLLTAEGGTRDTHCCTMARSRQIEGPYELDPENPVLSAYETKEWSIQYAGHGDMVEDQKGNWYLVHLGVRRNKTDGYSIRGRETFLEQAYWTTDGWLRLQNGRLPAIEIELPDACQKNVENARQKENTFFRNYDFTEEQMDIHLLTLRIPWQETMSLTARPGWLRMYGGQSILSRFRQSMLVTRVSEIDFTLETLIEFEPVNYNQMAGLVFYYNTANFYYFYITREEKKGKYLQILSRNAKKSHLLLNDGIAISEKCAVRLRGTFHPESISFSYQLETEVNWNAAIVDHQCSMTAESVMKGITLSDEYATISRVPGFTGAMAGICVQDLCGTKKPADFAWLEIHHDIGE